MSDAVKFVKSEILDFLSAKKADVGHALNARALRQRAINWNPKQTDALEPGAEALVEDGILENRDGQYFVTQQGVDKLYQPAGNSVRDAVLSCFSGSKARVGDALNVRTLQLKHMIHWNPKQKEALDSTLQQMEAEELIESKGGDFFLTQKGFDTLY